MTTLQPAGELLACVSRASAREHVQTDVACAHCGLPVPGERQDASSSHAFCCDGCRTVYALLRECGLDQYYRLRDSLDDAETEPVRASNRSYEAFDDAAFANLYVRNTGDDRATVELYLERVHCAACVWLVEKLPRLVPGVQSATLNLRRGVARITWQPSRVSLATIAQKLDAIGYPSHPLRSRAAHDRRRREGRQRLIDLGIAGALAGNVMVISFALYGGVFHGMESSHAALFRWTSLVMSIIALAWPGRTFFRGAIGALRARAPHMDLPIALGLSAGVIMGAVNTIRGTGEVYFDSLVVLIFLLLIGRFIQHRQQRLSADSIEMLFSLTPRIARRWDGTAAREVPVEAIAQGDTVEIRAGETIPIDGIVREGESSLDLALLTGETAPVAISVNEPVHAGTTNLAGRLLVQVTATGEATRIGRLMQLVESSAAERTKLVQMADRLAGRFILAVIILAIITVLLWWSRSPSLAFEHALALLVVTCPCALGLATPLALVASVGRGARRGILIKKSDAIERLARPGLIVLDKTGTVTTGSLTITHYLGDETAKPIIAAIERLSSHPVAKALTSITDDDDTVEHFSQRITARYEHTGRGVDATINTIDAADHYRIGSLTWLNTLGITLDTNQTLAAAHHTIESAGSSTIGIARNGHLIALIGLGDQPKADAAASIAELRARGWGIALLSGDASAVVRTIGARVGLDPESCHGGVTPEEKLAFIRAAAQDAARNNTRIIMVGDGVNDAAALAAADVGIAIRGGAEASLEAADVSIRGDGLAPLIELIDASRRTMIVIRRNLAASLGYNALGVTLAMTGVLNPIIAAIMMPISSLTVITLSFRSRTFRKTKSNEEAAAR